MKYINFIYKKLPISGVPHVFQRFRHIMSYVSWKKGLIYRNKSDHLKGIKAPVNKPQHTLLHCSIYSSTAVDIRCTHPVIKRKQKNAWAELWVPCISKSCQHFNLEKRREQQYIQSLALVQQTYQTLSFVDLLHLSVGK